MPTTLCKTCAGLDTHKPFRGPDVVQTGNGPVVKILYKHLDSLESIKRSSKENDCDFCSLLVSAAQNANYIDHEWDDSLELFDDSGYGDGMEDETEACILSISARKARRQESESRSIDITLHWVEEITGAKLEYAKLKLISGLDKGLMHILDTRDTRTDKSTGSPFVAQLVNRWIGECDGSHEICRSRKMQDAASLPSRVVFVGDCDENVRLICPVPRTRQAYACLSHCWGSSQHFTTETSTLHERMAGIDVTNMPKTFREAVHITRGIGLQYLWIDSLCILQDSADDWNVESAKMGRIYRGASITIFAAAAEGNGDGCFMPRDGREAALYRTPMFDTLVPQLSDRSASPSYIQAEMQHAGVRSMPAQHLLFETVNMIVPQVAGMPPLERRGWVLQEQILSFRSITYDVNEVRWHCPGLQACECIPEGFARKTQPYEETDPGAALFEAWQRIVERYTNRKLTYEQDKLPALSGIASEFSHMLQADYLAGLWRSNLREHLGWSVASVLSSEKRDSSRPLAFRAPSWSWASMDGADLRISVLGKNNRHENHQDFRSGRLLCDILDCWVKPLTRLNQFGKVHSGALVLRGRMNTGRHSTIAPARFWTPKQGNGTRTAIYDIASGDLVGWFDPDVDALEIPGDQIWCMPLHVNGSLQCLALTTFDKHANIVNPAGLDASLHLPEAAIYTRVGTISGDKDPRKAMEITEAKDGVYDFDRHAVDAADYALLDWLESGSIQTIVVV